MTTDERFRQSLGARDDGFWEVLATAVGRPESVQKSVAGIRMSAMREGIGGPASTPSIVQRRVEAIAAHEPEMLLEISSEWTKPRSMSSDIMDGRNDLLMGAWVSAMRFLTKLGAVSRMDVESQWLAIADEAKACFGETSFEWRGWINFVERLSSGDIAYVDIRALDSRDIDLPVLSASDLRNVLASDGHSVPGFARMRIFRRRDDRLTADATSYLCDALLDAVNADPDCLSNGGFCVAAEIAVASSDTLRTEFEERVMSLLSSGKPPEDVAPIAYILLQSGWSTP